MKFALYGTLLLPVNALIDWSLVPSNASNVVTQTPLGCTCKQPEPISGVCTMFDCSCPCDLTAGVCDANCCCDNECTQSQLNTTSFLGQCTPISIVKPIQYCDANMVAVNDKYGILNVQNQANGGLCVYVENSEVSGTYFTTPNSNVSSDFNDAALTPSYTQAMQLISTPKASTLYNPGDPIMAFFNGSAGITPNLGGYLMLPTRSVNTMECFGNSPIAYTFGLGKQSSKCILGITNLSSQCTSLGMVQYIQNLLVSPSPRALTSSLLKISLNHVYQSTNNGRIDITANYSSTPVYSISEGSCSGVLLQLAYNIKHDGNGILSAVEASVVIGTVVGTANIAAITREFTVSFTSTSPVSRSQANSNLITYPRSGNPGYLLHLPLRGGNLVSNGSNQVISEVTDGVHLFESGMCSNNMKETTSIKFGEDVMISCAISLNFTEFQTFCMLNAIPSMLTIPISHIAAFGNADPFKVSDWIEIEAPMNQTSSGLYVASTCTNVITGAHIQVSYMNTGDVNDPQRKISAVQVVYSKDTLDFLDVQSTQTYFISTTLTYRKISQESPAELILPAPDIWFSIPEDAFYPFFLSQSSRAQCSLITILLLTIASLYLI